MVKLFSKNSNLCDHNSPTLQTDRQTTCDRNTALCTKVHRAVIIEMIDYKTNLNCNLNEFHNWNITAIVTLIIPSPSNILLKYADDTYLSPLLTLHQSHANFNTYPSGPAKTTSKSCEMIIHQSSTKILNYNYGSIPSSPSWLEENRADNCPWWHF